MGGEDEWGSYDSGPAIAAQNKLDEWKDRAEAAESELKRYREREPLVQDLLRSIDGTRGTIQLAANYARRARAVLDFKLSASAAEGDESA